MNKKLFNSVIKAILISSLLVGLILIWVSFQSYDHLASLLNHLAADGKLEAFDTFIYRTLKLPSVLVGFCLVFLSGFMLLRWNKTENWIWEFPAKSRHFFKVFGQDSKRFLADAKVAVLGGGWLDLTILLGITLVAIIVRLANIHLPLTHDEAYMYEAFASRSFWHMISNYHLPNNHVLLSIFVKITTVLLGNHVWTLRLPSIIVGVLMIPAAYWFAKGQYSRETAILGASLVAVFPALVQYSVYSRGYSLIALTTLLLFVLGFYIRQKENRFAWLLLVIFSALGFFTIPIMLFSFGALYIWLLASFFIGETRSYKSKLSFLVYWAVSGISTAFLTIFLYLPIIFNNFDRFFGNGFIAPLDWDIFPITLWVRVRNTWLEWMSTIPLWLSLLGVLGLCISIAFHKKISKQKFPVQIAFFVWIATLLIARRPDMLPRFWLFLAAPLLVWSVAGIVETLKMIPLSIGKGWNLAQISVGFVFALIIVQGLLTLPTVPYHWNEKDGVEHVTIYLKDQLQQNDLVTASVSNLPPLRYYFAIHEIQKGTIRQAGKFQHAYVIVDSENSETLDSVAPKLGFDFPAVNTETAKIVYQFGNYTVYKCEPAS